MTWLLMGALVPGMLVAWAAAHVVRRLAPRLGLVDQPGHRKVHHAPTPLGGGLAIWAGVVLPLAAGQALLWLVRSGVLPEDALPQFVAAHTDGLAQESPRLWGLVAAGTVLVALGLIDDRRGLDWRVRLTVETLVAVAVVALGFRLSVSDALVDWPLATGGLTVLWIVALVNAFNMLDNMDGLSAGVAAIAASILAAVLLLAPNPESAAGEPQLFVAGLLLVLVGGLAGFLWHNRPPARLFMGDAGSYFIGFLLAVTTVMATFAGDAEGKPYAVLTPLCVLAVPLYDLVTVVCIRLRAGRSPFEGDKSHFSHRLVELGMTNGQAVATIYLATATCGLGALVLHQVDAAGAAIVLLLVGCVLTLVGVLETAGRRNRRS